MGCGREARATTTVLVRLSITLTALSLALGLLLLAPVPSTPAQAASPQLKTTLDAVTPSVTAGTRTVELRGRIQNTGSVPLSAVKASLWVSTAPITTREQLTVVAGEGTNAREGRRIAEPTRLVDDITSSLRPGAKASFTVRVPVSLLTTQYGMTRPGIYLVGVDIRGLAPGASIRDTWRQRTFLPWIPAKTKLTPVEVAYLLPLTDDPDLVDENTLLDTRDADRYAPAGRLSRLLDLGQKYDLSYLVDPAVLEQARVMQDGYDLFGLDDQDPSEEGSADAARFIDKATGLLSAGDTLLLPYADPDLPALQRRRMTELFGTAVMQSDQAARAYQTSGTTLTWPGSGYADAGMLETIAESGGDAVLLRQEALPSLPADGTNPVVELVTPAGSLTGLVADPSLTAGGPARSRSTLQTRQRFLAETALLALRSGAPTTLRRVVAAFPRTWDPGKNADNLFDIARRTSWLSQIPVSSLLTQPPREYGGQINYPAAEEKRELDRDVIEGLQGLQDASAVFLDLLTGPGEQRARASHNLAFLRGASTAWRQHPERGTELVSKLTADLETTRNDVRVIAPQVVTLSSSSGRFPVTIDNNLRRETVRVQLEATSDNPELLKIRPIPPIEIGPLRKATIAVEAEALRSGPSASVRLRLRTVDTHTQLGGTAVIRAHLRGYGRIGWAVIGAGAGLLMLVAGFKVVRRILRARRAGRHGANAPETKTGTDSTTAEPAVAAGDPAADTEQDEPGGQQPDERTDQRAEPGERRDERRGGEPVEQHGD